MPKTKAFQPGEDDHWAYGKPPRRSVHRGQYRNARTLGIDGPALRREVIAPDGFKAEPVRLPAEPGVSPPGLFWILVPEEGEGSYIERLIDECRCLGPGRLVKRSWGHTRLVNSETGELVEVHEEYEWLWILDDKTPPEGGPEHSENAA